METLTYTIEPVAARPSVLANRNLRVGIVGAGLMGHWHAHASRRAGGEIIAVADKDQHNARAFAAKFAPSQSFSDAEEMLSKTTLDVLHICSPTPSHQPIAEAAIKAGVHLLIEKPLASNAAETIALYDLAESLQVNLCPVHQFAFQSGVEMAKKNLARIGRLVHLEAKICSAGGTGEPFDKLDSIAVDILPHPLSLMQTFLGNNLSDQDWQVLHPQGGELRILNQVGEISLSILISMRSRPTTNYFQIIGTEGTIHLDLFHGYAIIESGKTSQRRKIWHPFDLALKHITAATFNLANRCIRREPAYPGLRELTRRFYQTIRIGTKLPVTPAEAIAVASIRDHLIERAGVLTNLS